MSAASIASLRQRFAGDASSLAALEAAAALPDDAARAKQVGALARRSRKRVRDGDDDDALEALQCPITHELPVDPVTGGDGFVYERAAIVQWRRQRQVSPMTGETFSGVIHPCAQVRSAIDALVEGVEDDSELVASYKRRRCDLEEVRALARTAKTSGAAAFELANWHLEGKKGLAPSPEDFEVHLRRAARLGHPTALAWVAMTVLDDEMESVQRCHFAYVDLGRACERGSRAAWFYLYQVHNDLDLLRRAADAELHDLSNDQLPIWYEEVRRLE
jgi:hypothetical protein